MMVDNIKVQSFAGPLLTEEAYFYKRNSHADDSYLTDNAGAFNDIISFGCPLQLNAEVFEKMTGKSKWLNFLSNTLFLDIKTIWLIIVK